MITNHKHMILIITLLCGIFGSDCFCSVIRVPAEFATIQEGINAAADGDTVMISDGYYTGENNTNNDFHGKSITVMSEQGALNCIIMSETPNHRGFCFQSGEGETSVLRGITMLYGNYETGGAICCESASPTILECIFSGCSAGNNGGAIYLNHSSSRIEDCRFSSNHAVEWGGAICCTQSNITLTRCRFWNNRTTWGGALFQLESNVSINNSLFIRNKASKAGGYFLDGTAALVGCEFRGNIATSADGGGGALYVSSFCTVSVEGCSFTGNNATQGGAIFIFGTLDGGTTLITTSRITGNYATTGGGLFSSFNHLVVSACEIIENYASYGAGICTAGPIHVVNCLISQNHAIQGGGAGLWTTPDPEFINCTFVENEATQGSVIYASECQPSLINSIIWDNASDPIHPETSETILISYSDVQGGFSGIGNINLDPGFVASGENRYCLSQIAAGQNADSPCINMGSNQAQAICFDTPTGNHCLDAFTTRTDGAGDTGIVDSGYHYPVTTQSVTPSPTETIPSSPTEVPPTFSPTSTPSPPPPTNTGTPTDPTPTMTVVPPTVTPSITVTTQTPTLTPSAPVPTSTDVPTMTTTPSPTITPSIPSLGVDLALSSRTFRTGDLFDLRVIVANPGPETYLNLPLGVVLDFHGEYFFYPGWSHDFDFNMIDLLPGVFEKQILRFEWPYLTDSQSGIFFYAALLSQDFTAIIGRWDIEEFGWEGEP